MPIYEYECKKCGHQMEMLQKMSDLPLVDCPECGTQELKKLVSAAGFRLKGGGWYETDFKSGSKKNLVSGDKAGDTKNTKKEVDSASTKSAPSSTSGSTSTPASSSKSE